MSLLEFKKKIRFKQRKNEILSVSIKRNIKKKILLFFTIYIVY